MWRNSKCLCSCTAVHRSSLAAFTKYLDRPCSEIVASSSRISKRRGISSSISSSCGRSTRSSSSKKNNVLVTDSSTTTTDCCHLTTYYYYYYYYFYHYYNYIYKPPTPYRDLKLENFLYEKKDGDFLKLIDFGFSKAFGLWSRDGV